MIICKICNPNIEGNGYCGKHSTGGSGYNDLQNFKEKGTEEMKKEYKASELLIAALERIRNELERVYWNKYQKNIDDPFENTGNEYKNNTFEVCAYSWDDNVEQPYNFKWIKSKEPFEVSWYKYFPRGIVANRIFSPNEIEKMLEGCLKSLYLSFKRNEKRR